MLQTSALRVAAPSECRGSGHPSLGGTVLSFAQPFPGCKSISVGVPQGLPPWVYIGHVQYYDYFFSCFSINQHSRAVNPPISWVCWDCVGMCVGISDIMGKTRCGSSGVCVKSRKPVWSWQYSELLLTTLIYLTLSENRCFTGSAVGPLSHQWFFAGHWFVFFFFFLWDFKRGWRFEAAGIEWLKTRLQISSRTASTALIVLNLLTMLFYHK